jgi:hypothetical protein
MANSRDFTGKNRKFTGTKGITVSKGTTGERVGSESGEFRFNTTTELMEYYDGNQWKSIDAPPSISSVNLTTANPFTSSTTPTNLTADGSTLFNLNINGTNFSQNPTVKFIGNTSTEYSASNVTRVNSTLITCTTLSSMGSTDDPYDVSVTNTSGLSSQLDDQITFNAAPVFNQVSNTLGQIFSGKVLTGSTLNASATDAEGNTITYSLESGSVLPGSGLSLSSSTGYITGTYTKGTTANGIKYFTVVASTAFGNKSRMFAIEQIDKPAYAIDFLVVAGGGGGGDEQNGDGNHTSGGGGGGAGGYRLSTQTVNPLVAITVTVGDGGSGGSSGSGSPAGTGNTGSNSSISGTGLSTITSAGGGGGGSEGYQGTGNGKAGGSGGGGGGNNTDNTTGGAGNTPNTSPSQGNNGGSSTGGASDQGGSGGGGAGGVGTSNTGGTVGSAGGAGAASSITGSSVTYAGGGGGGGRPGAASGGSGGGGAGGTGSPGTGTAGTTNRGGGGGGAGQAGSGAAPGIGGAGGKGIVILSMATENYSSTTTGSPTVTTSGSNTILQFTGSGSYTT